MSGVVRLAIVDPDDSSRSNLKNMLLGIDTLWLEAECARYEFFIDVAKQTTPEIALVSLDTDPEKGLDLVLKLGQEVPNCSVLVVSSSQEGRLILRAMRNGAKEFLALPLNLEDFMTALGRIKQTKQTSEQGSPARSSQIISVVGVSGGIGCTSLAVNLGCALAQDERNSVAIMDLDMALGDADVWLDIIPDYTIQDVAENISRLDFSLLKRSLTKHNCGAFLLPRPVQMEENSVLTSEELKRVIALLKATFTHLIIDVSKSFTPIDMMALSQSNTVLALTQLDLPSLRNIVRVLQFFDQYDNIADKVQVVVNRIGLSDSQISLNKALETIGRDIGWQFPNDYATMIESRNNGIPLVEQAPRAKLTKVFQQMAQSFSGAPAEKTEDDLNKKGKSIFSLFKSK
ncbi:Septum site-determining protein MinD [Polystyrenella longa]|uniref:Septum site-determining protein MinD n=1 Tax=Polystyrenella longa TaxID=2528007 RepID=A0A518CSN1_9PLAN|nr:AAA family ATPase [Polystyrenella longa]QDU82241.1 Septum site-determining protein MinD [Polystyrenella longa]